MKTREDRIASYMRYCQHYDASGITMIGGKNPHGHCKAGVVYFDQFPNPTPGEPQHYGIFQRVSCLGGADGAEDAQRALCPKWERTTREQAETRTDELDQALNRHIQAMTVVGKWRTWTKANRVAKAEVIECPCCKGRLHLSQAAYNGHVHGKCETAGCLSWME